jgi:predicted dehydrogenase
MSQDTLSRRSLLRNSAALSGAAAFQVVRPDLVRGAGKERLRAGLIGCGGRGTAAVVDLLTGNENVELRAMADVFEDRLERSLARLREPRTLGRHRGIVVERAGARREMTAEELAADMGPRIRVDPDKHFTGFDAFRKLVASDVDIVLLCTPPAYRPMHFEAAVAAGKHVFTEKPIATDPVNARRFLAAGERAAQKKLTVVAGAQRHADRKYIQTVEKIQNGAIGDVVALFSRYLSGPVMHAKERNPNWGDMEWQHRNWYSFVWICGDQIVEQHYHNLDFMNWVMGGHPSAVVASGGVAWRPRTELYGNIYDHMSSEFEYPNGVRLSSVCRQYPRGLFYNVSDLIVGSKGRSTGNDLGEDDINSQVMEHIKLVDSILGRGPYLNESRHVAEATLTAIMARESAYSGQRITWEQIMASQQDLLPKTFDYKAPMPEVPVAVPGVYKFV